MQTGLAGEIESELAFLEKSWPRALPAGGPLILYGPFRRDGAHTTPSNAAFDEDLRARDPEWGLRDIEAVAEQAAVLGFGPPEIEPMPANHFILVFRRR